MQKTRDIIKSLVKSDYTLHIKIYFCKNNENF